MNETKGNMQNQATKLNNQAAQLRNLEVQMGQMASLLMERQHGSFPNNSEANPKEEGKEYCKAITLRSGRELEIPGQPQAVEEEESKEEDQVRPKIRCKGSDPKRQDQLMTIKYGKRPRKRKEQMNPPYQFRILNG